MFEVWLTNFGRSLGEVETFSEAVEKAVRVCLECSIFNDEKVLVATWSPIGGLKRREIEN